MDERTSLETTYQSNAGRYEDLRQEVQFALKHGLRTAGVKFHTIDGRVKSPESFLEKVERKQYDRPLDDMPDLVGVRVVVLFLSDMPRVSELVKELFDVRSEEDRVNESADTTFGYMSIHYVAALSAGQTGPRYDALKDLHFEVQVRTIVMDAWANISHYLAYKGESSIPQRLRRDFNALSGLFYVADQHFELFVKEERASEIAAQRIVEAPELQEDPVELNLDTVVAVLHRVYADREHRKRSDPEVSRFVAELRGAGIDDARQLERLLRRAQPAMEAREKDHLAEAAKRPPEEGSPRRYVDVPAARVALSFIHNRYRAVAKRGNIHLPPHEPYRHLIKP